MSLRSKLSPQDLDEVLQRVKANDLLKKSDSQQQLQTKDTNSSENNTTSLADNSNTELDSTFIADSSSNNLNVSAT